MDTIVELERVLTPGSVVSGQAMASRHRGDWGVQLPATEQPLGVVYPRDAAEVSSVLKICGEQGCPVVPQGG